MKPWLELGVVTFSVLSLILLENLVFLKGLECVVDTGILLADQVNFSE